MSFLKEYRCKHCSKLFFKGDLKDCTIQIKCKNCKNFNMIKGVNCKLFASSKKEVENGEKILKDNDLVSDILIECERCKKKEECDHYRAIKDDGICPLCRGSIK